MSASDDFVDRLILGPRPPKPPKKRSAAQRKKRNAKRAALRAKAGGGEVVTRRTTWPGTQENHAVNEAYDAGFRDGMAQASRPRGCLCPPTSEQTCQSQICPRKPVFSTVYFPARSAP